MLHLWSVLFLAISIVQTDGHSNHFQNYTKVEKRIWNFNFLGLFDTQEYYDRIFGFACRRCRRKMSDEVKGHVTQMLNDINEVWINDLERLKHVVHQVVRNDPSVISTDLSSADVDSVWAALKATKPSDLWKFIQVVDNAIFWRPSIVELFQKNFHELDINLCNNVTRQGFRGSADLKLALIVVDIENFIKDVQKTYFVNEFNIIKSVANKTEQLSSELLHRLRAYYSADTEIEESPFFQYETCDCFSNPWKLVDTPQSEDWSKFYPLVRKEFKFLIAANSTPEIALAFGNTKETILYKIVIGGTGNTLSAIFGYAENGEIFSQVYQHDCFLEPNSINKFQIEWKVNNKDVIITLKKKNCFPISLHGRFPQQNISYVAVRTLSGRGKWAIGTRHMYQTDLCWCFRDKDNFPNNAIPIQTLNSRHYICRETPLLNDCFWTDKYNPLRKVTDNKLLSGCRDKINLGWIDNTSTRMNGIIINYIPILDPMLACRGTYDNKLVYGKVHALEDLCNIMITDKNSNRVLRFLDHFEILVRL